MQKIILSILLCFTALVLEAQVRTAKRIEQDIEQYEIKISEKERAISKNNANGTTAGNRALEVDIAVYESEIQSLLKELKSVQQGERTEESFMALQQKVNDLEGEVGACSDENTKLKAEIAALKKQLANSNTTVKPNVTVAWDTYRDSRDGEVYKTIQIGSQLWMSENMRYNVQGSVVNPDNPNKAYGRLYTWSQAMQACPSGWHLPSDEEWKELERYLGMSKRAVNDKGYRGGIGDKLKSQNAWKRSKSSMNSSGFNAMPAGYYLGFFVNLNKQTRYWTSTEQPNQEAWLRELMNYTTEVNRFYYDKEGGYSCRCLKD